ncbi:MAG: alpha-ketoacid dehydrogenase subunit beta [candidate division Zixibacteria bacterium]|nr:alpha-ketoacid dehydrogenase subunit beta [Candidatus Tariuqbacter arcticus]
MRYFESLNAALHQLMREDERVYVMGEDILDPYGGAFKVTKGLSESFPGRTLTTPVSEAAITGIAIGMAMRGLKPVLEIMFGDFVTLIADQLVNSAVKFNWMYNHQVSVPLVIRVPMGGRRGYGPTHSQTLESMFMGVPGLKIIAPSHYHNPGDLLKYAVSKNNQPLMFIENKRLYPQKLVTVDSVGKAGDFYIKQLANGENGYPTISLSLMKNEPPQVTLITYGGMAPFAIEAAMEVFMNEEILVEILLPSALKPLPVKDILPSVRTTGKVVVAEEGVKTSGWGAELASVLNKNAFNQLKCPVERVGAKEFPIPSSMPLEKEILPGAEDIVEAITLLMGD